MACVVRRGNPRNISRWEDLLQPGLQVCCSHEHTHTHITATGLTVLATHITATGQGAAGLQSLTSQLPLNLLSSRLSRLQADLEAAATALQVALQKGRAP